MPVSLNHSNINIQYETGSNYIIETVKSDLYRKNENIDTVIRNNIQTAPVTPTTFVDSSGNVYAVESYTYSGTANTADYTRVFTKNTTCDILIVGGGGGGSAGGGGAGGYVYNTNIILNGTYAIKTGKGGAGATGSTNGSQGANSSLIGGSISYTAYGGGGGGGNAVIAPAHTSGQVGSYGGNGHDFTTAQTYTSTQGNRGGRAFVNSAGSGGGGGGAGTVGNDGSVLVAGLSSQPTPTPYYRGGQGGTGLINNITGVSIYYAGGGTAGVNTNTDKDTSEHEIVLGGGGFGARGNNENGGNGTDGLGGGGGGGDWERTTGTIGGSGIVIIRYLLGTIPTSNLLSTLPTVSQNIYPSKINVFTHSGGKENQTMYTMNFPANTKCDILIVGGGGGGGNQNAGGGGAGGLVLVRNLNIIGTFNINVGKGGNGGSNTNPGLTGNNSTFTKSDNSIIITANGGGGGGGNFPTIGKDGGSGGGGAANSANGNQTQKSQIQIGVASPAILNQFGENGGHGGGGGASYPGGGGGGAGSAGYTQSGDEVGANGGLGIDRVDTYIFRDMFSTSIGDNGWFAGGGGSGGGYQNTNYAYGNGGSTLFGGGGNGDNVGRGINGINGTGGGGGGVRYNPSLAGGNGGSGIVIVRVYEGYFTESTRMFVHNGSSENQSVYNINIPEDTICDMLIVAGGGGGGMDMGGGGGGGGVIELNNVLVSAGTYTVKVGKGGDGAPAAGTNGQQSLHQYTINGKQGSNSSFDNYIAIGGGYGGSSAQGHILGGQGGNGGSGGGSSGYDVINNVSKAGKGVEGQGFRGGYGGQNYYSGGGGGAGEVGGGPSTAAGGAYGGRGKLSNILGIPYYWGGGGGGAGYSTTGGNGGLGGGGGGAVGTTTGGVGYFNGFAGGGGTINSQTNRPGGNGAPHTGGGGGGGSHYNSNNKGGDGGSGIVIIKLKSVSNIGKIADIKSLNFSYEPVISFNPGKRAEYLAEQKTGVGGWRIVRFLPPTSTVWYQGDFINTSTFDVPRIGMPYNYTNEWAVPFETFDEICFGTLGMTYWLRCLKTSVLGTYSNTARPIISSSFSSTPYTALWYNRGSGNPEDPWISIQNYPTQVVYGDNQTNGNLNLISLDGGMCVLVRDSTKSSVFIPPSTKYTVNFPTRTIANINTINNVVLEGEYDITINNNSSSVISKTGKYIPNSVSPITVSTIGINYNILNPILDPVGAQWTYSSNNTNVYNIGSVGIGTSNPQYSLDINGTLNAKEYFYNGLQIGRLSEGMVANVQHLTYTHMEVKNNTGWDAINDDLATGFVISITPKSNLSKILVNLVAHIGLTNANDGRWWGFKLYRQIGMTGWVEVTGANGTETGASANTAGTPVWISNNMGTVGNYSERIINLTGTYLDSPNTTSIVYYTAWWNQRMADNPSRTGELWLNRAGTQNDAYRPAPSSSWTLKEIWYG